MVVHMADDAPVGQFAKQRTDEGGFARAVLPDEHSQLSAVDVHGHVMKQRLSAPRNGQAVNLDMAQGAMVFRHGHASSGRFLRPIIP